MRSMWQQYCPEINRSHADLGPMFVVKNDERMALMPLPIQIRNMTFCSSQLAFCKYRLCNIQGESEENVGSLIKDVCEVLV